MTAGYRISVEQDDDSYMVTFPDFPEAVTFGDSRGTALAHAVDAIQTAIMGYMTDRRDIPLPSKSLDAQVALPLLAMLKIELYRAMRARGWRKADLARALGKDPRQIDRLIDLRYATPVVQIDAALKACGRMAVVESRSLAA